MFRVVAFSRAKKQRLAVSVELKIGSGTASVSGSTRSRPRFDHLERTVSLVGAGAALLFALATVVEWIKNVATIATQTPSKANTCLSGYHFVKAKLLCEMLTHTSRSQWEVRFLFITIVALCILYFALRRKRAGVACFSIFLGLGLGVSTGLVFFLLGAWLIVRAYRLQKYW